MAVTQYIGARYVPVFADPSEWDNTRTYEPLTIVLHNGASYTSAQYVPVGIDILNTEFWQCTGNYNAQVEKYREEVNAFDERITANADAITAETSRAGAAEKVNADAIAAETNRASAAEKVNADAITAETSRASAAEKVNADAITAETSRASAAESELDKMNIYRSAKEFGISPDNDDNADAMQKALDYCAENGYTLYVPNGTYNMSHKISLPWYVHLTGHSCSGTIFKFSSNAGFVTDKIDSNGLQTCVGCILENIQICGALTDSVWDSPSVELNYTDKEYAFNYSGLGGWFTASRIRNVYIRNFICCVGTYQPSFTNPTYNDYNYAYGDLRLFDSLTCGHCYFGIRMGQYDAMISNCDIQTCFWGAALYCTSGSIWNDIHVWHINKPCVFGAGSQVTNLEVESIQYTSDSNGNQFNGAVLTYTDTVPTVFTNLKIWNITTFDYKSTLYQHPLIRNEGSGTALYLGVSIGRNPSLSNPSVLPSGIISAHGTASVTIIGAVTDTITSIDTTSSHHQPNLTTGPVNSHILANKITGVDDAVVITNRNKFVIAAL